MDVSCDCCVLSGRGVCATVCSLVKRSPTERGVSDYDLATSSRTRAIEPGGGYFPRRIKETMEYNTRCAE